MSSQPEAKKPVKEDLSRMEGAYGSKMIGKLKKMKVFISGMTGAGIETAKNLLLAGPHTVTIHDDTKAEIADLGVNFYMNEDHVKKGLSRADASSAMLGEINPNTYFSVHKGEVTNEFLKGFSVAIFTDQTPLSKLIAYNKFCRANNVKFIVANIYGMQLSIFSDFGDSHEIFDSNGATERSIIVSKIDIVPEPYKNFEDILAENGMDEKSIKALGWKDKKNAVFAALEKAGVKLSPERQKSITTNDLLDLAESNPKTAKKKMCGKITIDGTRHLLDNGFFMKLDEIKMSKNTDSKKDLVFKADSTITDVNSVCEVRVHRTNASVFYIGDISGLGEYKGGGIGTQVKMPRNAKFNALEGQVSNPRLDSHLADYTHFGHEGKVHATWVAIKTFQEKNGALPKLHDEADAKAVVEIAKGLKFDSPMVSIDEKFVATAAKFCRAETNAYAAMIGGFVAQEAMKQTGKYSPIKQWIHLHSQEMVDIAKASKPQGNRYDHYRTLFGDAFVSKALKSKFFLVGCGALGCEFMKNIAMCGLGCSKDGQIHITDDDIIELSNLSRQFLFRRKHVKKLKSESAAEAAIEMNPDLKSGLKLHKSRVEPKTEKEFNDKFWGNLDFVINALDNLKARNYVDGKCVTFSKILFESGTLGTQANQTIHVPHKTPSYAEGSPPGEGGGIAMCTMTNFPFEPLHCIEWARMMFGQVFEDGPTSYEDLRKSGVAKYLEKTGKNVSEQHGILKKTLKWVNIAAKPTLEQCISLAFEFFNEFFTTDVRDLVHNFPEDARNVDKKTKADKGPFWQGRRRFPRHHDFSMKNKTHTDYIYHTACIYADVFGLTKNGYPAEKEVLDIVGKMEVPKWVPTKKEIDVGEDGGGDKKMSGDEYQEIQDMRKKIEGIDTSKLVQIFPADFEKDEDTNHHIDWITSSTNLRAWTRRLKESTKAHCRMIAGRIIAAIATATASITGFVFLEVYKVLQGNTDINQHRWSTINLATNVVAYELPPDPKKARSGKQIRKVEKDNKIEDVTFKVEAIPEGFTCHDFIEIKQGDLTIPQFLEAFPKVHHGLKVTLLAKAGKSKGGSVMYMNINEMIWKNKKKQAEFLLKRMKNPMQRERAKQSLEAATKMLSQAELQTKSTIMQAYKAKYGELSDPNREFVVLTASVVPADRELDENEVIEIPNIKFYFK